MLYIYFNTKVYFTILELKMVPFKGYVLFIKIHLKKYLERSRTELWKTLYLQNRWLFNILTIARPENSFLLLMYCKTNKSVFIVKVISN